MRLERPTLTYLQRAFQVFETTNPNPISAAFLSLMMACDLSCAYDYIKRLKGANLIVMSSRAGRRPLYVLAAGASMPPPDARGRPRRRMRPSAPISQFTAAKPKT